MSTVIVSNLNRLGVYAQKQDDKVLALHVLDDFGNLHVLDLDDGTFDQHCDFMIDGFKQRDFYYEDPRKPQQKQ